jgi:phenylacetate-coenzyme A ligase PaaK-like adenylate-forming protein
MTPETIKNYFSVYRQKNICFVVGYTSCIYKLAKYIYENNLHCGKKDSLKAVILTAETVTKCDVELLRRVFHVPVVIEYGMAETGVIAYSYETTWNIKILWDSFVATAGSDQIINITTIYDKLFPLINYHTEDVVEVGKEVDGSILEVSSILGRKRDVLRVGSIEGSDLELSGILMVHALKSYPHIFSIQFEQLESNGVRIFLVADRQLDLQHVKMYFLKQIRKDHKNIDASCLDITQVDTISKTLAGKERTVRS